MKKNLKNLAVKVLGVLSCCLPLRSGNRRFLAPESSDDTSPPPESSPAPNKNQVLNNFFRKGSLKRIVFKFGLNNLHLHCKN